MVTETCCAECGAVLPAGMLGNRCPRCLVRLALATGPEAPAPGEPARIDGLRQRFGDYELLEKVAEGGMGVVYRARQVSLDRIVAVKMIQPRRVGSAEMVLRFRAEAEAAASLHHSNIVPIHETGEHEGQHYFSMDYIEGKNLAEAVREGPFPSVRAAQVVEKIASAVHYAHQHKVLHRDLKPSNVILDEAGEPQVMDFGLAKRLTSDVEARTSDLTLTGQVFGSPRFMPPEQASGRRGAAGVHSDVYGLGAILYYLLAARPPFVGETMETTLAQVLEQEPVSPRLLNASVPRDLETICLKCLEKEPSRRYGSAQAVADELSRFLEKKPIQARPVGFAGKTWRWCRRKPALATALGAVVVVATAGFVGILAQWRRAEEQRRLAEEQRRVAEASELFARQNAYAADVNLAQRALEDDKVGDALGYLNKYRPEAKSEVRSSKSEVDLRGWEWRYLWQLCQPDDSVRLQTSSGSVGVAISRDGKVLAVENGSDKIVLWDLTTKRQMTEVPASPSIESLSLSSTGNLLAVSARNAQGEPTVEVWDVPTHEVRATLAQPAPVRSLAFSPNETLLATFDDKGHIAVVDWAAKRTLTNLVAARPPRHLETGVVAFSPDGSRLAIGEDYGRISILDWLDWRLGTMVAITNVTQTGEGVGALAFSPSSELLATGFGDGTICLWDTHSGEPRRQWASPAGSVRALAFTPDGQRLASASSDRTIRIWSVADQVELHRWRGHESEGRALAFLPDGKTLVSGCDVGTACFWDVTATNRPSSHARIPISFGPEGNIEVDPTNWTHEALDVKVVRRTGFAFTPDGRNFITTDPGGTLGVWDAWPPQRTETLPMLGTNIWGVALSPDGRWLAVGDAAGQVTIWDWPVIRRVTSSALPFEWLGQLHFSRSGQFLWATSSRNQDWTTRFKIWRTADWQEVPLPGDHVAAVYSMDFSPDDRRLAVGFKDGTVRLWDFPSGQHATIFTNHTGPVTGLVFLPDGRRLASTSFHGAVKLQELFGTPAGAKVRSGAMSALNLALSPDGRRLATGRTKARDAIRLWDLATQREILSLPGEDNYVPIHIAFSPDGNTLVALSFAGIANLWHAPSWAEIEAAEKGVLTP